MPCSGSPFEGGDVIFGRGKENENIAYIKYLDKKADFYKIQADTVTRLLCQVLNNPMAYSLDLSKETLEWFKEHCKEDEYKKSKGYQND